MIPRVFSPALAALAALAACAGLACKAPEPSRALYQWTDAEGNVRYTPFPDRIPDGRRHTRLQVEPADRTTPRATPPVAIRPAAPPTPDVAGRPTAPEPSAAPGGDPALDELDARIAALETRVAADEEALKALISDPAQAGGLRDSPALSAIAERLPALQKELAALREQRARSAAPPTTTPEEGGDVP